MNLTPEEREVGDLLGDAWNKFCRLPVQHPMDPEEFTFHIHALQNLILARPTQRQLALEQRVNENKN